MNEREAQEAAYAALEAELERTPAVGPGGLMLFEQIHPYYEPFRQVLLDWFDTTSSLYRIPGPIFFGSINYTRELTDTTYPVFDMVRQSKVGGMAVSSGEPFFYYWRTAKDQYGRWCSGRRHAEFVNSGEPVPGWE